MSCITLVRRHGARRGSADRRRRDGPQRDVRGRDVGDARDCHHRALPARAGDEHHPDAGLMAATRRINIDLPLVIAGLLLSLYGLAVVYSAGQTDVRTHAAVAYRAQAAWMVVGIIGAFAVSRASVRFIEWLTVPLYGLTILLLLALLAGLGSGGGTATSTTGWLTIGGHRLGQPAEFAKLTVVLMLARVLGQNRVAPKSMIELWKPMLIAGTPLLLIM